MKNITVTVEDCALEWVRIEVAKRNTNMSKRVGEMIADKMRHDDFYERAMREVMQRYCNWTPWLVDDATIDHA
jgi:hypothetical protein